MELTKNMKAITTAAVIEGIRARKDRSLGLTVTTPELSPTEKAMFMELQGINITLLIEPTDAPPVETHKVDGDLNQKSQSSRIRSVLYILWTQTPKDQPFEEFYHQKTEKYIEYLKGKIEN